MLLAFCGIHIPLLALLFYFTITNSTSWEMTLKILGVALVATLSGTGLTLFILHKILAPVTLISRGIRSYLTNRNLPELPTEYTDELGILMSDVGYALRKLDTTIQHMANYERLTGLPNRKFLLDRLQQLVSLPKNDNNLLVIFCLDIDEFKNINNMLGYSIGDMVLTATAQRIENNLDKNNLLAHLGGDEFIVVIENVLSLEKLVELADRLLTILGKPFIIEGQEIQFSASIGIAVHFGGVVTPEQLLTQADTAMQQAKAKGRNNYQFFSPELNLGLKRRLALQSEMRRAIGYNQFMVHYQPQLDLQTGEIIAVEALARWQHPELGLISPNEFIPIAEANGFIIPLGEWILRQVCQQIKTWQTNSQLLVKVAVNLSARQLKQENLVSLLAAIIQETNINPGLLELEMTESLAIENLQKAVEVLHNLKNLGVSLALDDFGTGYSSLSYLGQFPVEIIKIDRSFVQHITLGNDSQTIIKAIIAIAHQLELEVIAEGVETQEQLEYLQEQGCDKIQGYYVSKPLPVDEITQFLITGRPLLLKGSKIVEYRSLRARGEN